MGRKHKILLVDDNQELLRLLGRLVEAEGWQPVTCTRGGAAIEAVDVEKPAVAIVDVLLPDMMGYDVGAALEKAGVPFVFMTGIFKGGRAASEARVRRGAAGYFEKPFEARKLLDAVRGLLPPEPPPRAQVARVAPGTPGSGNADFDMEASVDAEESVEAFELTGKVEVNEAGAVSAVIRGEALQARRIPPGAASPAPPAKAPRTGPPDEGDLSARRTGSFTPRGSSRTTSRSSSPPSGSRSRPASWR
jgi:two-component system, OmpR family, response regulator